MPKYETRYCTGFLIPDDPTARKADFFHVKIALGSWDEEADAEDESIFYYMDGIPLEIGLIVADNFVITDIEGDENA